MWWHDKCIIWRTSAWVCVELFVTFDDGDWLCLIMKTFNYEPCWSVCDDFPWTSLNLRLGCAWTFTVIMSTFYLLRRLNLDCHCATGSGIAALAVRVHVALISEPSAPHSIRCCHRGSLRQQQMKADGPPAARWFLLPQCHGEWKLTTPNDDHDKQQCQSSKPANNDHHLRPASHHDPHRPRQQYNNQLKGKPHKQHHDDR